jgi:pimeloyl-ACP methyl ester carboxylesterase
MKRRRLWAGILLGLLALFVLMLAAAWAPDRPVQALTARWAQPPSEFLALQGMDVHLRDEGRLDDPQPLLLLHGTSASLHTWDGWVEALTPARRVLRVDLPGFGLTGPFPHDDYHIARYVHFVEALLDELALDEVILAGNSFGGQIAWESALALPERVAALVLVDAAGYPLYPESVPVGFRLASIGWLQALMRHLLPRGVIEASLQNVYGNPDLVTEELVDRYYELTLREGNRRALSLRLQHALPEPLRAARIPSLAMPTLVLWGELDRLIPLEHGLRFADEIPASRLVIFECLGHVPHEEAPGRTVAEVLTFLEELRRPVTTPLP